MICQEDSGMLICCLGPKPMPGFVIYLFCLKSLFIIEHVPDFYLKILFIFILYIFQLSAIICPNKYQHNVE